MLFRGDARAAGGVDVDGQLRHRGLYHQRVGDDADVGAQADQLDGLQFVALIEALEVGDQLLAAEGGLCVDARAAALTQGVDLLGEAPALRAHDAVLDGQHPALLGLQVVLLVGVYGHEDGTLEGAHLLQQAREHLHRLRRAERAGDEVILHVDYDKAFHSFHLPLNRAWRRRGCGRRPSAGAAAPRPPRGGRRK